MTTLRTLILAVAGTLAAGAASAGELRPAGAASLDLGTLAGVAYYTPEPAGYRVTVTLAPRAAAPAARFEAVLASGQSVTVSTPREAGAAARAVTITRTGDAVTVIPVRAREIVEATASIE
ncbi:hypothetical protein [Methylobacterium frigidaeris]|uniref:Uncharacterized protein n=1 Tax=Methylobacterium frigidaeris TaxID=2038277 RepID=A0AA37HFQ4_9HYPH|nr:hypothetical protein [Methylobacterium frigidaeris]PIK69267.1 hypothetical protein CS379_30720 [Methylobacterium frigidaeris]GJD65028.1 hypothetical protein MPEAHAMD_5214 [Methylobacterium frigidaeris]